MYPRTKDKTVGLIKNYHVIQQPTPTIPVKEEVVSAQKISDTKKNRTDKRGESDGFHCVDPNHWAYKCTQLLENDRDDMRVTNEKGGLLHCQVSDMVEYHEDPENRISMLMNHKANQREKLRPTRIYLDN